MTLPTTEDPTQADWILQEFEELLKKLLDEARDEILKLFPAPDVKTHAKPTLATYLTKVDKIMYNLYQASENVIEDEMSKGYEHGQLYAAIKLGHSEDSIQRATWRKVGNNVVKSQSSFKGTNDATTAGIKNIISEGVIHERTWKDISNDVEEYISTTGRNNVERIVRTETMAAVNQGVKDRYKSLDIDVVEWVATRNDNRTCERCLALDGRKFKIDEMPPIPLHPSCRCTISAVPRPKSKDKIESWSE